MRTLARSQSLCHRLYGLELARVLLAPSELRAPVFYVREPRANASPSSFRSFAAGAKLRFVASVKPSFRARPARRSSLTPHEVSAELAPPLSTLVFVSWIQRAFRFR